MTNELPFTLGKGRATDPYKMGSVEELPHAALQKYAQIPQSTFQTEEQTRIFLKHLKIAGV